MKTRNLFWSFLLLLSPLVVVNNTVAVAQVVPDNTLPINSQVSQQGNQIIINGGTRAGTNLFHSFKDLSLPTGVTILFNNAQDIQNIITRVTGGTTSTINGLIQANGVANLFLLNSNGLTFGPNASLKTGGSFFSSTAASLLFADGTKFSVKSPQPLLTVSIPTGLQMESNSGEIRVQGSSSLNDQTTLLSPITRGVTPPGLLVAPEKTLALVGNKLLLEGATLTAENGQIELGSVSSGLVTLIPISEGWSLDYETSTFQNILLSGGSLLDTSGIRGGSIQLRGGHIEFKDGSVALIQNVANNSSNESLKVNASSLNLIGTTPSRIPSALRTSTVGLPELGNYKRPLSPTERLGFGKAADIVVSAEKVTIQQGAVTGSISNNKANAGNVTINAREIEVLGVSPLNRFQMSNIQTLTSDEPLAIGRAGSITLSTQQLTVKDGAFIAASTVGPGTGGDLTINAKLIELISAPSYLGTRTFGSGNSGSVTVDTDKLIGLSGGRIDTSTLAKGNAGNITVNADVIELSGTGQSLDITVPSSISSSAIMLPPLTQRIFGLPAIPDGQAGSVTINTRALKIKEGGQVSVQGEGPANSGVLEINANLIDLNSANITAASASREGGNILVNSNSVKLDDSNITASTGENGNGGNITIDTKALTLLQNSSITANAVEGQGGNITIDTRGLFVSPDSQITASSETGINGTVQINAPETGAKSAVQFPDAVAPPDIPVICAAQRDTVIGELVNAGTGGVPVNPDDTLISTIGWQEPQEQEKTLAQPTEKVEAQGWVSNGDGTVSFVADPTHATSDSSSSASICKPQDNQNK